jgi:hypothetical protein
VKHKQLTQEGLEPKIQEKRQHRIQAIQVVALAMRTLVEWIREDLIPFSVTTKKISLLHSLILL